MEISEIYIKRFWSRTQKTSNEECWNWTACINSGGYALMWMGKTSFKMHKLSWIIHNGQIPNNLFVCHTCDNRKCVNPNHLFLGTWLDNNRDRKQKNRNGVPAAKSKLSRDEKYEVLHKYNNGISQRFLAKEYNVSQRLIWNIINPDKLKIERLKRGGR